MAGMLSKFNDMLPYGYGGQTNYNYGGSGVNNQAPAATASPLRSVYNTAQNDDYTSLKSGYDDLLNRIKTGPSNAEQFTPLAAITRQAPQSFQYQRSSDLDTDIGKLNDFADTGGFSEGDLGNIRARAVAPLRAAYATAERELSRRKSLQGGYSPNAGAVTAKLAREQGELGANASTNVEAEIAKLVQSGKLSALSQLSPLLANENNLINQIGQNNNNYENYVDDENTQDERSVRDTNSQLKMRANEINNNNRQNSYETELSTLNNKRQLVNTTPAMSSTFSQQVLSNPSAVQTANQIKNARAGIPGFGGNAMLLSGNNYGY